MQDMGVKTHDAWSSMGGGILFIMRRGNGFRLHQGKRLTG
jgi:hypothetical protein